MATMLALLHRDMRVARRELKFFFLRVGIQPILFTFIFGYVMPRQGIVQTGYANLLLPGILALSMTLSGMQSVALPLVVEFGWTREIEDRLLAPISIMGVAVEKIIVGIIQAIIAGLFVLPLAWLMMGSHLNLQPRTIDYPETLLTRRLRLLYGLADQAREGCNLTFKLAIDGQGFHEDAIIARGLKEIVLDTALYEGKKTSVRFQVQATGDANGCVFAFDGGPE